MRGKFLPFTKTQIEKIIIKYPTPFHIYDEKAIRENARAFKKVFSWNEGFKEFFAIKAAPNPYLVKILHEEGYGADCSSLAELIMAQKTGVTGEEIMFSSNDTPAEEFLLAKKLKAIINLDDISHISYLEKYAGLPSLICFRYNPGKLKKGNHIIGHPEEAKYANGALVELPYPTNDVRLMTKAATEAVNRLFRPGFKYSKAEVLLMDLRQPGEFTDDLFAHSQPVMADKVMSLLDEINGRWGKGVLRVASVPVAPGWAMRRELMSQSYTTKVDQLWTVRAK